ncbi:MAG: DUF2163 domain-containing protein, partial [Sphingomicrobium sp.]
LEAPSSEIHGVMSDDALTDDDLQLGRWDSASISLIAVDWRAPLAEAVPLLQGEIGSVSVADDGFSAELTGAAATLDAPVCPETSSECRAALGDRDCRIDLGPRRMIAVLSGQIEGNRLTMTPQPGGDYVAGSLVVVSGPMTGFRSPILGIECGAVVLRDPPRDTIGAGAQLWLTQGCDKRFGTCRDRFANAINFRGEPHLPGNDLLTRYPGA